MSVATITSDRRDHERRGGQTATPRQLLTDASTILARCGVDTRGSWLRRTVTDYCRHVAHTGYPFGPWLMARVQLNAEQRRRAMHDPELHNFLCYFDPTGESAVRNVMRRHG